MKNDDLVLLANGQIMRVWAYEMYFKDKDKYPEFQDADHKIIEEFESKGKPR